MAEAFGKEITDANLIQTFTLLLSDGEVEVRNAAINSLKMCLKILSPEKISSFLLPNLQNFYVDAAATFKAGVSAALCEMAHILGKEITNAKILPMLMDLIKDENSDVRLNVTHGLIKLTETLGPDLLTSTLLTTLSNMIKDGQWRVREAVYNLIGDLGKSFGKEVFQDVLESIFMNYFADLAASVRSAGIKKTGELAKLFGSDWVVAKYLKKVNEVYSAEKQGYLYRMCALHSIMVVMPVLQKEQVINHVLPIMLKATKDPIPNVKFSCCKLLVELENFVDPGLISAHFKQ